MHFFSKNADIFKQLKNRTLGVRRHFDLYTKIKSQEKISIFQINLIFLQLKFSVCL